MKKEKACFQQAFFAPVVNSVQFKVLIKAWFILSSSTFTNEESKLCNKSQNRDNVVVVQIDRYRSSQ